MKNKETNQTLAIVKHESQQAIESKSISMKESFYSPPNGSIKEEEAEEQVYGKDSNRIYVHVQQTNDNKRLASFSNSDLIEQLKKKQTQIDVNQK